MASYRPTDGTRRTETVPLFCDSGMLRVHDVEVTAEYLAADSECGQRAGWYFEEAAVVRGKRRRQIRPERWRQDELMEAFEKVVADLTEESY